LWASVLWSECTIWAVALPHHKARPVKPLRHCFEFMKRHERSFLISGFLVLFVTFVVRDVLLDRTRRMADTLSAAETEYLLEDATVQLHHEIDAVDGHVMSGSSDILANLPSRRRQLHFSPDPESILNRDSVQYLRMDSETNSEFASLYRLLEVLPANDNHRADFATLYARWDKDQVELLRPQRPIGEKVDPAVAKAEAEKDRKHRQDMWAINGQLRFVGASILDDAHRTLEDKEHEANVFAWWSYALYFIGGILALGGKMAGIEVVGA
jgi:hypothetical protein